MAVSTIQSQHNKYKPGSMNNKLSKLIAHGQHTDKHINIHLSELFLCINSTPSYITKPPSYKY